MVDLRRERDSGFGDGDTMFAWGRCGADSRRSTWSTLCRGDRVGGMWAWCVYRNVVSGTREEGRCGSVSDRRFGRGGLSDLDWAFPLQGSGSGTLCCDGDGLLVRWRPGRSFGARKNENTQKTGTVITKCNRGKIDK